MLKVFIGVDKRQPLAYTVCRHSIERRSSKRVSVEPLKIKWTPITRRGLTDFTFARYAVPYLSNFEGVSIFMDGDILVTGDVHELAAAADPSAPVSVVKGPKRFEWPSVMVFQNALCKSLTPEYINNPATAPHNLAWSDPIGELPREWNFCVGYEEVPVDVPKLIHFTAGIPCWPETKKSPYADLWWAEYRQASWTVPWESLMGGSVHAPLIHTGIYAEKPISSQSNRSGSTQEAG